MKNLIIFGDSSFAEIAYEYFTHDSHYEVVAFTVTKEYLYRKELFEIPIIPFEEIEKNYSPDKCDMFIALTYAKMNLIRSKFYIEAKQKGYRLANYISSKSFLWRNVKYGENIFIFEDNTVQPFVNIGNNVVLWSGNHIGHHSKINDDCFISSHVVISGHCEIGKNCFIGVNSTIGNNVIVGDFTLIGGGALIVNNVPAGSIIKGKLSEIDEKDTFSKFNL